MALHWHGGLYLGVVGGEGRVSVMWRDNTGKGRAPMCGGGFPRMAVFTG
jgi:hypothetical protein